MTIPSILFSAMRAVAAWWRGRQGYARLCALDDRALSDLGLTRSDLRDATASGFFDDPTTIVAARADERVGHRRPPIAKDFDSGRPDVPALLSAPIR